MLPSKSGFLARNARPNFSRSVVALAAPKPAKELKRKNAPAKAEPADGAELFMQRAVAAAASLSLLFATPTVLPPPAQAEVAVAREALPQEQRTIVVRLPASANPEVFSAQRTLVQAWSLIAENFVDDSFNGQRWQDALRTHMLAAYASDNSETAYAEVDSMIDSLGDTFTRRIAAQDYGRFRVTTDGEMQGVGLLIANEPTEGGHLRVVAPIKGGPADRAGVKAGDEVLSINGNETNGLSGQEAAAMLKGETGTMVRVKLARRTDGIPGVASVPEAKPKVLYKDVSMHRERVMLSAVYHTVLPDESSPGSNVGYLRLAQFNSTAAEDMRLAIQDLESQGVSSYILDLRNNTGGLVSSGIEIAKLFMDGDKEVFNIVGRQGFHAVQTTESDEPAETHKPLAVLVNEMSASASEILTGALHDNHRAVIVGDHNTYGKGRIQSVYELQDGSALFLTVAMYQTPGGTEIDMKGIHPDMSCHPQPAVKLASGKSKLPLGPSPAMDAPGDEAGSNGNFNPWFSSVPDMERAVIANLKGDACVLAAEGAVGAQQIGVPSLRFAITEPQPASPVANQQQQALQLSMIALPAPDIRA